MSENHQNKCSACDGRLRPSKLGLTLSECARCSGLHESCYRGDAYGLVGIGDRMQADCPPKRLRYFDLTLLGSDGINRIHGWFDRESRKVVQYG